METVVETTVENPTLKKENRTKLWLGLTFGLSLCLFSMCMLGGSLVLWQRLDDDPGIGKATAFDRLPQSQPEDPVLPTAPPLINPTPFLEPTPAPPTPAQQTEPIIAVCPEVAPINDTAILTPTFSPISFAPRQDDRGWPREPALQFTTTTTQVLATFGYAGMRNGMNWERVWLFGDEELSRGSGVWDAGARGKLTVQAVLEQGGFAPGLYKLEIYVAGQLFSEGSFLVVSEEPPHQRPVEVAYTTWEGDRRQINLLNLAANETELLLEAAHNPAWSADGRGLLFYGERGIVEGTPGLWVFNTDQGRSYQINEELSYESLAWSPHRTYVASTQSVEGGTRLVLWDINQNQVFPGPPGADPAWSPDGLRVAYRSCDETGWHISTLQVIGSNFDLSSLQHLTNGDDSQPAWSWDGQRIAFVRQEGDNRDIYTVRADGSNLVRLTDQPGADVSPAWTPDHRLIFRSLRAGQWGLYLMNADGSGERKLVATDDPPEWQPDRPAVSPDVRVADPPPPEPQLQIPAGHGLLAISNRANNDEMTFTIDNVEHKIGPFQVRFLPLRPGRYTWTASWPGKTSRTGFADIGLGQVAYPVVER